MSNKKAAQRPTARTVHVVIADGDFAGWEATFKADFSAGVLADFNSSDMDRILKSLSKIILEHNFPNDNDEIAESLNDVEPYDGLMEVLGNAMDQIGKLPNR